MKKIRCVIVDDEKHCYDHLSGLILQYCTNDLQPEGIASSVDAGVELIRSQKPELVFLDVEIGAETGFDLLKKISERDFEVIFTTAHDKYAVQAFRFSAMDYLLKPVDPDELVTAVSKVKRDRKTDELELKVATLLDNYRKSGPRRLTIATMNGLDVISVDDILRCESDKNYTTLFLTDKRTLVASRNLKEFEEMLSDHGFFRTHNSHLINLKYVKSYAKGSGGFAIMTDGKEIEVSVRRKEEFLKALSS